MFHRGLSLHEIVCLLEKDEELEADRIYIQPPAPSIESDEDSADEDDSGTINNMPPKILQAQSELVLTNNERIGLDVNESDNDLTANQNNSVRVSKKVFRDWKKKDIREMRTLFPESSYLSLRNMSPLDIFEQFWDESVIEFLIKEATNYALFKNCADPKITRDEMKSFLGILIVSGYNPRPSRRHYWDSMSDM